MKRNANMKGGVREERPFVIADAEVVRQIGPWTIQDLIKHHLTVRESIGDGVYATLYQLPGVEEPCLVLSDNGAGHFAVGFQSSMAKMLNEVFGPPVMVH